jgi:hypothetical protein
MNHLALRLTAIAPELTQPRTHTIRNLVLIGRILNGQMLGKLIGPDLPVAKDENENDKRPQIF